MNSPEVRIAARQPSLHFLYGGELSVFSCQFSVVVNDLRDFRDLNDPSTAAASGSLCTGLPPGSPYSYALHPPPLTADN